MNREEIIKICKACPESFETLGKTRCGICKCFIDLKAVIGPKLGKGCPLKKW